MIQLPLLTQRAVGVNFVDVYQRSGLYKTPLPSGLGTEAAGVVVVARTLDETGLNTGLMPGDTIHALNRTAIDSVETLRRTIKERKRGDSVVLQIEREGRYRYLFFVVE